MPKITNSKFELTLEQKKSMKKWIESPEFDEKMKKSMEICRKQSKAMHKAMEIDWKILLEPFTI